MDFSDEIERITRAHCEIMGYTKAAAPQERNTPDHRAPSEGSRNGAPNGSNADPAARLPNPAPAAATLDPDSPLYRSLQRKPPEIWTYDGPCVFKRGALFAECDCDEDAWFIADRLNNFDANLCERNEYQRIYLQSRKEDEVLIPSSSGRAKKPRGATNENPRPACRPPKS